MNSAFSHIFCAYLSFTGDKWQRKKIILPILNIYGRCIGTLGRLELAMGGSDWGGHANVFAVAQAGYHLTSSHFI
jgi:hypothetical protein